MSESATEEYTAYDRGDLCSEIDRALGDILERTMQRYMPQRDARNIRRSKVQELADKVIEHDTSGGAS